MTTTEETRSAEDFIAGCPVLREAEQVLAKADDLSRAMRRLRRSIRRCDDCPFKRQCPPMLAFSAALHEAIRQVTVELNLEWTIAPVEASE